MPPFRIAVPLVCVALLAGCGVGNDETPAAHVVKRADLGRMIVPKHDLGPLARGLKVDGEWSGRSNNTKAIEDTIDPKDTARSLTRAGRVQGHDLTYAARRRPSALGVLVISQGVELFRTEKAASTNLNKQFADFKRFRGRKVDGIRLARVQTFDVDLADEAVGLKLRVVYPSRVTVFSTIVAFRRGRVVGNASVLLRRDLLISGDVERIADAVDDRIKDVVSGETRGPVSASTRKARPRKLDPKSLTLQGKDLPLRTELANQGYWPAPGVRVYLREYDVLGERLAGSKVFYLRTNAQVFKNARAAAQNREYLATTKGSNSVARRFLRAAFRKSGFTPRKVTARPLPWRADDTAAFHFFFRAPKGRIEGVLLSVTRGRVSGSVLVMGLDQDVEPGAVLALREKLRARLRGH